MKERPILFSAPMVRAILEGRKTQTRRVVRDIIWHGYEGHCRVRLTPEDHKGNDVLDDFRDGRIRCPYGQPGDRLWVRETWATFAGCGTVTYRASNDDNPMGSPERWRPSIHMPRWASRIDLEVTGVRVERLQDISEADAMAEGIQLLNGRYTFNGGLHESRTAVESFQALWDSINGQPHIERDDSGREIARHDFSWDANPWVWVVEFRRVKP